MPLLVEELLVVNNLEKKANYDCFFFHFLILLIIEVVIDLNAGTSKKDFFYVVVLILTLITVVIGFTFAVYYFLHRQEEGTSAVYTGTLSVEYLSGNIIDFHLLYPSVRPSFDTEKNVYRNEFRIRNTGSLDGIAKLSLNILENEFTDKALKYILFNSDGVELYTGEISKSGELIIADNLLLEHGVSQNYVLIVWLNESFEDQNVDMQKYFSGTIVVDLSQKKD